MTYSVADFREEMLREQALAALCGVETGADGLEVGSSIAARVLEHAPGWGFLRFSRALLPDEYIRLTDPTQIDGRVEIVDAHPSYIHFRLASDSGRGAGEFFIVMYRFVEALLAGEILDAM